MTPDPNSGRPTHRTSFSENGEVRDQKKYTFYISTYRILLIYIIIYLHKSWPGRCNNHESFIFIISKSTKWLFLHFLPPPTPVFPSRLLWVYQWWVGLKVDTDGSDSSVSLWLYSYLLLHRCFLRLLGHELEEGIKMRIRLVCFWLDFLFRRYLCVNRIFDCMTKSLI